MSLVITILMLISLILVCGYLIVASTATFRQWAEPGDGLGDLNTPPPEEEGWWQNAEALADNTALADSEGVERIDLSRLREVD